MNDMVAKGRGRKAAHHYAVSSSDSRL
jgi:hypothetical protein